MKIRLKALRIALGNLWIAIIDPAVFVEGYEEGVQLYCEGHDPKALRDRCLAFANDLWKFIIEKEKSIPEHEHWDQDNCNNLRNLIAAFARKHFGDLERKTGEERNALSR